MLVKVLAAAALALSSVHAELSRERLEALHEVVSGAPKGLKVNVRLSSATGRKPSQQELSPQKGSFHIPFRRFYDVETAPISSEGPAAASGTLAFGMQQVGWNNLEIETVTSFDDDSQAYAAGYVEGSLTQQLILQNVVNEGVNSSAALPWPPALASYLHDNFAFMHQMIVSDPHDMYNHQLWLTLLQLQGLYDGYLDNIQSPDEWIPIEALINIQIGGDMDDLSTALGLQSVEGKPLPVPKLAHRANHRKAAGIHSPANDRLSREISAEGIATPTTEGGGHCSAVVRLMPGNSDIFISQISWSGLEDMNRIYKTYRFNFMNASLPGRVASFSSFPGSLFSGDDWYTLQPSNLVVLETTIGNSNMTLYQLYVKPTTILDWARNIVANRLATDAQTWYRVFSNYNSGTYNNEWFVLDYKLFTPGMKSLQPNTFVVIDQAPGFMTIDDRTKDLEADGYFGSYNVASNVFIYNVTGGAALAQQLGPWFSWYYTARAEIFRRDAPKVGDETAFRALTRYNDFQHDPFSTQGCENGNPPYSAENAIAARDDLNPASGNYSISALGHRDHVAIDSKTTSYSWFFKNSQAQSPRIAAAVSVVQAGPTYDQQPPFSWATTTPDIAVIPHLGQPVGPWMMPWTQMAPAQVTLEDGSVVEMTVALPLA